MKAVASAFQIFTHCCPCGCDARFDPRGMIIQIRDHETGAQGDREDVSGRNQGVLIIVDKGDMPFGLRGSAPQTRA